MLDFRKLIICTIFLSAFACASGVESDAANDANPVETGSALGDYVKTGVYSRCIEIDNAPKVAALNDDLVLFRGKGSAYVNAMAAPCAGAADPGMRIAYTMEKTALCEGDEISVVNRTTGEETRRCTLGEFEALLSLDIGPETNVRD